MWSVRIGSLFDVPVELDATFLIVLPVFAYVIGSRIETTARVLNDVFGAGLAVDALTGGPTPWILGTAAAIGLFAGVLAHEFGHSLVAMHYDYEIDSITLWIFGGIAKLADLPRDWREEFAIAAAGPIVSVAVGILSGVLYFVVPADANGLRFVLLYLAVLNVVLAVFNLVPAFPMDGGRILRALLGRTRPFARATAIAAQVGKAFALLLGLFGLYRLDPIVIGIAFFVYIAATSEAKQVVTQAAFEGVAVRDVMTPVERLDVVAPNTTVQELLERMVRERHTGYPVVERGEPVGIVTLSDARDVRDAERVAYTAADVMSRDLVTIEPDDEAMAAFAAMREHDVGRLLVVDRGRLAGLVSRTDLLTALEIVREGGDVGAVRSDGRSHVESAG